MAIVNKDFSKEVVRIEAISIKSLETIKEWLRSLKIKFYESKANLNWKQVIKAIINEPFQFRDNGGWEFLNVEATDSEDEVEDGSEFKPDSNEYNEYETSESGSGTNAKESASE